MGKLEVNRIYRVRLRPTRAIGPILPSKDVGTAKASRKRGPESSGARCFIDALFAGAVWFPGQRL